MGRDLSESKTQKPHHVRMRELQKTQEHVKLGGDPSVLRQNEQTAFASMDANVAGQQMSQVKDVD